MRGSLPQPRNGLERRELDEGFGDGIREELAATSEKEAVVAGLEKAEIAEGGELGLVGKGGLDGDAALGAEAEGKGLAGAGAGADGLVE